jgi:DNA-binding FrmR family transcriptional regulator
MEKILNKIVRIEGQVKGIREMVEEGRECTEILTQIMAARAALESVALDLVDGYLEQCIPEADRRKLVQTLKLFLRRW